MAIEGLPESNFALEDSGVPCASFDSAKPEVVGLEGPG